MNKVLFNNNINSYNYKSIPNTKINIIASNGNYQYHKIIKYKDGKKIEKIKKERKIKKIVKVYKNKKTKRLLRDKEGNIIDLLHKKLHCC